DVLPHLGGSLVSFTKIVGFLLAISWLAKVSSDDDSRNDFLAAHPTFSYVLMLFIGWTALSITWAERPGLGTTPLLRYALNLILFLIVFTAVRRQRDFTWAVGAYVLGSALAAGYGILNPPQDVAYYDVTRVSGTIGDPNELAAVLVGGTVLAAGLAATLKNAPLLRLGAGVASALCAAGIFLSLSRVGVGNYQTSAIHYLLKPGALQRDEFIVDTPKVAHNTYLQVLAELGIVGAALFLAIIGFSLLCILRAARIFERLGDAPMELMSRALLVALCGVLAADFFISEEFSKQLWLLLGLGPALLAIAASSSRAALSRPESSPDA